MRINLPRLLSQFCREWMATSYSAAAQATGRQRYVEPFFLCVQRGDLRYLVELLTKDPEGINAREETGQTLLHCACALGQLEIVIYLLNRRDCNVSEQDEFYHHTPLHMACMYNESRVVIELLKKLSSVEGSVCVQDKFGWTPLHHAARNGNVELCKLLVSHDCRPHVPNELGKTACHYAAERGHLDVLKYLYDYVERMVSPPVTNEEDVPPLKPTLLHCAALHNQTAVVEWLQGRVYPPHTKCRRILDLDRRKTRDEFAEDVAVCRGHNALRGVLSSYRMVFEGWVRDIQNDTVPLDRIKLCICGHARVGKSAMRESLSTPFLRQMLGMTVPVTSDADVERHTFGIDITMMHLSTKDIFSVWDFAGQVDSFITHHFFISTQSTVFTVLVKLTTPIEEQRLQLLFWLGFIKTRNLGQKPFIDSPMEQDLVPMSTSRKPRRRLLTAKQMQRPQRRQQRLPTEHTDSPVPVPTQEQNGMEAAAMGSGGVSDGGIPTGRGEEKGSEETRRGPGVGEDDEGEPKIHVGGPETMYGSYIDPVPVLIVGSHYDKLEGQSAVEAVQRTQQLVDELREQYEEYLNISPRLYPLNCLTSVSPEIRALKERMCEVRSELVELQPRYPRVMEKVARQIESLRAEQTHTKVLSWEKLRELVKGQNRLLSEKQLSYICKCLTDAGVMVYFEEGALSNHIIIDPAWLCKDVLGQALAPGSFLKAKASLLRVGSHEIAKEVVREKLSHYLDSQHIHIIIQLLRDFELCHHNRDTDKLCFPAFLTENLDPDLWTRNAVYESYVGRRLVCSDMTDSFPPGFFSRLQVQVLNSLRSERVYLFKGSFLVEGSGYQCLVSTGVPAISSTSAESWQKNTAYSSAVTIIARASKGHSFSCCQHLDLIQTMIAQLVRVACPTIFLDLLVLSSSDLKAHSSNPYCYTVHEVISAESKGRDVTNGLTGFRDSPLDLLYLGDEAVRQASSGRNTKVAYLSNDIVQRIEALLVDGDKDWRDLARKLGLDKYIQLLESRSPHSTRLLLLKWGEKPRWTVDSLLYALHGIGRIDVANFIRARMGLPKK